MYTMKWKEGKALKEKFLVAVKKTLKENDETLTDRIEKVVRKSIKQVIKKNTKKVAVKKKPTVPKK